jgi:hypothetical protein
MRFPVMVFFLITVASDISAQWLNYPTRGVPRTPEGKPNLSAPAPRTPDGKPDFSGLWEPGTGAATAPVAGAAELAPEFLDIAANRKERLPYRPWALDLVKSRQADNGKGNPDGLCLPLGMIRMHSHPFPRKIIQIPGLLVFLYEKNVDYRQIFTDGRPLPPDAQPSFNGYSTGKWDGDTLTVETIGFRDDIWLDGAGNPITESAKVTEKFRRPDFGHMEIEITIDDSKAYTAPWTVKLTHYLRLDSDLLEYFCENERDIPHLVGR